MTEPPDVTRAVVIFLVAMFSLFAIWTGRMIVGAIRGARSNARVVSATDQFVVVDVKGVRYHYLLDRPQPLSGSDAAMLRNVVDTSYLRAMLEPSRTSPWAPANLVTALLSRCRKRDTNVFVLNTAVLNYLKDNAVQVDIDGEQCLVITPSVLAKLERGNLGQV